jgi:hypothetical protein
MLPDDHLEAQPENDNARTTLSLSDKGRYDFAVRVEFESMGDRSLVCRGISRPYLGVT